MNEEKAFLRAICANPDDDTVRLVFADWLDEHDRYERAELIRVQCERASRRGNPAKRTTLLKRQMQLIQQFGQQWFTQDWPDAFNSVSGYSFDRGFVDTVSLARRGLRDTDIVRLLETRPFFSLVHSLNLSMNAIGDTGLQAMANCPRLAHLRTLILTDNPVTLQGVEWLAASPHLSAITEVTLNHSPHQNMLSALVALVAPTIAQQAQAIFRRYGKNVRVNA